MSDAALPQLHAAKAYSDQKRYAQKHRVLAIMMKRNPKAFVIDSDDGNGIVGITHVDTGYRLHMPVGAIPVPLEKAAANPFHAIRDAYRATKGFAKDPLTKTVGILNRNPRLEQAFRSITDYRLLDPRNMGKNMRGGAYLTSPLGALTGALTGDTKEEKLRNTAIGAVAGAGAGAAAGRYLPRVGQKAIGRVLTNLMDPHIYDGGMHWGDFKDQLKAHGAKGIARAIIKDQPIQEIAPARHALFRDYFGLKRFKGTDNVFNQIGQMDDGGKLLKHNMRDLGARADLRDIHTARRKGLLFGGIDGADNKWIQKGKTQLASGGSPGNFGVRPDGSWEDVWDFALHKGQKIDSNDKLLRALVTPFGTPSKVVGKTLNESQVLRFSRPDAKMFNRIHPSFTQPVIDRTTRGAGLDSNQLKEYMNQRLNRGGHSPIMSAIAARASGKPYNLLQNLAKAEDVSTSDMRVLLGGAPRRVHTVNKTPKWNAGDLNAMFSKRIEGANPQEVENALAQLKPDEMAQLRKGLTKWTRSGRPAGGETGVLARILGFAPEELPILLS